MMRDTNDDEPKIEGIEKTFAGPKSSGRLERRIVDQLIKENLITTNPFMKKYWSLWLATTAAGILIGLVASSFLSSSDRQRSLDPDHNKYLLLLYEDSTFTAKESEIPRLIVEYTEWSRDLSQEGRLIGAEKLSNQSITLGKRNNGCIATGYFVISAVSFDEAIEIANSHPHLKYDGSIEVRPIEKL